MNTISNSLKDEDTSKMLQSSHKNKKHKKKPVLYITLLLLNIMYIIAIGFVIFYYFEFKSELNSNSNKSNTQNPAAQNSLENGNTSLGDSTVSSDPEDSITIFEAAPVDENYFDNILFLGDSRFVSMETYETVPTRNIFAENGISAADFYTSSFFNSHIGTVQSLREIFIDRQSPIVYIALGVNGVGFLPATTVVDDINKIALLARECCPDTVIVIQSILPVSDIKTEVSPNLTNQKIDACNELLIELAKENGYLYMDLSNIMKNSEGKLHSDYDCGDGLHFNKDAYIVMKNYWRTHPITID